MFVLVLRIDVVVVLQREEIYINLYIYPYDLISNEILTGTIMLFWFRLIIVLKICNELFMFDVNVL